MSIDQNLYSYYRMNQFLCQRISNFTLNCGCEQNSCHLGLSLTSQLPFICHYLALIRWIITNVVFASQERENVLWATTNNRCGTCITLIMSCIQPTFPFIGNSVGGDEKNCHGVKQRSSLLRMAVFNDRSAVHFHERQPNMLPTSGTQLSAAMPSIPTLVFPPISCRSIR